MNNVLQRSRDCNTQTHPPTHTGASCALHMLCSFIHTKVVPLINTSPPQLKRPTPALESRSIMYVCKSRGVGGVGGGGGDGATQPVPHGPYTKLHMDHRFPAQR